MIRFISLLVASVAIVSTVDANRLRIIEKLFKGPSKVPTWVAPAAAGGIGGGMVGASIAAELSDYQKEYYEVIDDGQGVYVLYMDLLHKESAFKWADFWSKPDIYFVVLADGIGAYLIPERFINYPGDEIRLTINLPKKIPPSTKVLVKIYDDDATSDSVWRGILNPGFRVKVDSGVMLGGLALDLDMRKVSLANEDVVLDARDFIAEFEFTTPQYVSPFGRGALFINPNNSKTSLNEARPRSSSWFFEADILDAEDAVVGKMGFAQIVTK